MALFKNASPEVITLGAKDLSTRQIPSTEINSAQHCPLFYVFTRKGPVDKQLVDATNFNAAYGTDSLNEEMPYYNHATKFLTGCLSYNASCMVKRVIPKDAGVKANCTIYIDILPTKLVNYARNADGSLVPNDKSNDYLINMENPVIDGYRVKFIREHQTAGREDDLGKLKVYPGTMVDEDTGTRSKMYPLIEARAKYQGDYYNNIGFSIGSLTGDAVDEKIKSKVGALPFTLTLWTREKEGVTPTTLSTLYDEANVTFVFKAGAKNPDTKGRIDFERVFKTQWYNEKDPLLTKRYEEYEDIHFYRNNFEEVCKMFLASEKPFISIKEQTWADGNQGSTLSWYDFTTDDKKLIDNDFYLVNPFSCATTKGVKYISVQYDDGITTKADNQVEINMANNVPVFLAGGSDGTLTNAMFEDQVVKDVEIYGDPTSKYQDLAVNVENIIWDSGFTLETKEALANFILCRKDTCVVYTTHDATKGKNTYTLSETRARASALKTRLRLCPESTFYGTPVARSMVVCGTGLIRDTDGDERVPVTYDLMIKTCKMMGAGNGLWKLDYLFDSAKEGNDANPGSIITSMVDVEPAYIPSGTKPALWSTGINWVQPYNRESYHFPALKTIYEDDTSVLNSFFTVMALCTVTKINAEAFRKFTGTTSKTDAEFIAEVTEWTRQRMRDIFGGMIIPVVEVYLTEADKARGYSWNATTTLYGNNMRTKAVYTTILRRTQDLESSAS